MKTTIVILAIAALIGLGIYFFPQYMPGIFTPAEQAATPSVVPTGNEQATTTEREAVTVIGTSVEGRDISAYHFGTGEKELLFVGGIHGGYGWNTTLLVYELIDYLEANPSEIPAALSVTVIPVLNPDGLFKVVGTTERFVAADVPAQAETIPGRFNANDVDLNRNFDCEWQASGTWQSRTVSGGSAAFSEPESQAFKAYIEANTPEGVVVYYSAAGGVFASSCRNGVLPETLNLTNDYAKAAGYKAYEDFDFYTITGDMVNWLAKLQIPAVSVLLTNHTDTEWSKNLAGIKAIFEHYTE